MKKLILLAVLACGFLTAGSASGIQPLAEPPQDTGAIVRTYSAGECKSFCWTCNGPVQLDSVTVTVDTSSERVDGVKIGPGCTGTIGRIDILTYSADAMKVADGAHDLVINGGTVFCRGKVPETEVHQDGIQVMGGKSITFNNLIVDCGRADEAKIDANIFISKGSNSATPPTDVVCDHCWLGPGAAHTLLMGSSIRSGLRNRTTVCPAKYVNLALTIGTGVLNMVNRGTLMPASCSHAWFAWSGFDLPVKNAETGKVNVAKAGDLVQLGFGLGRDWGTDVLTPGYPASVQVTCPLLAGQTKVPAAPVGTAPGLVFYAGRYLYGWQTSSSWANTCRRFDVLLDGDAAPHSAVFKFKE